MGGQQQALRVVEAGMSDLAPVSFFFIGARDLLFSLV